jgi:hypothetical protein
MHSYNYRSVKAIAEYRYPQINQNPSNPNRVAPSNIRRDEWHDSIPDAPRPARRKQRSNNRAPDSSRAA